MNGSFVDLVDLASERLGGAVVAANDEFFAPKERLILAGAAVWREGEYTERGKWMDGWETRRRRDAGDDSHDWCVDPARRARASCAASTSTRRSSRATIPEACALDVCDLPGLPTPEDLTGAPWREVAAADAARPAIRTTSSPSTTRQRRRTCDCEFFPTAASRGCASTAMSWPTGTRLRQRGDVDLAAAEHGGIVVACSDMFFGSRHNLIMPGDATHMGDGWETKRRRGPGHDWTIIRLGAAGTIRRVEVDTRHFKGNAPGACSLDACAADDALVLGQAGEQAGPWKELLPRTPLQPHARHAFEDDAARDRRRDARAVQHFSRRRRRPAAAVREATMKQRRSAPGSTRSP